MIKILVGHTGFVGSNLMSQTAFNGVFNSGNIRDAYDLNPDVLVYSGVPAEKFLANSQPEKDFDVIEQAIQNIKNINPTRIILISTVDVYSSAKNANEQSLPDTGNLQPYGKNRLYLEHWVENNFKDYLILRLPALFGKGIKKNFIYDIINVAPSMLTAKLYNELAEKADVVRGSYVIQANGFYKLRVLSADSKKILNETLKKIGFTALNFTDSRAIFQFYNLDNLWKDINTASYHGVRKINLVTQPVSAGEIYYNIFGEEFINEIVDIPPHYDLTTLFDKAYGGNNGYILDKKTVMAQIVNFVNSQI